MFRSIKEWLNVRVGLDELVRSQLTEYRVPANVNIFYTLGFVAMVGYLTQAATGFLLLIYYTPHPDQAFGSVQRIMNDVPFGWLVRLIHVTGSNLLVVVIILHMMSVFFMGSYKKPRELTWVTGSLMLLITFVFCLSGYLLPWSQLSYWATTIVTTMPTAFPYVGNFLAGILRGGDMVSGATLGRFFALHVSILPALLMAILVAHVFLVRRIGVSSPPFGREAEEEWAEFRHEDHPGGHPFYPHFFVRELFMIMFFFAVMFFIIAFAPTIFLPGDANTPANLFETPAHIKPEWYFLAFYQMLRIIPSKFLGIMLQVLAVSVFVLWPFFDSRRQRNLFRRPLLLASFFALLALWAILSIWGKHS
jgi:ubiquinol-cytochrome c reductase cytochrome b subunit